MTEVKIYKTNWKGLKLLALTIPFIIIGIWLISKDGSNESDRIIGWTATLFFGLGIPIGFIQLSDKRPQIIITENGIWDRSTKQDEIKWDQIESANPLNIFGQKFITLKVDNSFNFKNKQYKWVLKLNKAIGANDLSLQVDQIKIDKKELLSFIQEMKAADRINRKAIIDRHFVIK